MSSRVILMWVLSVVFFSAHGQFKLYEKGHDSYSAGKYDEAIKLFSEYLTKGTRDKGMDVEVFYLRALSYYKTNKFKEAIGDFEECLLQNHTNKGNIYWFKAKSHANLSQNPEAIEEYTNALTALDADKASKTKLLLERGVVYKKMGEYQNAKDDFDAGLALAPDNADLNREYDELNTKFLASRSALGKDTQQQRKVEQPVQNNNSTVVQKQDDTKKEEPAKHNEVAKNQKKSNDPAPVLTNTTVPAQGETKKEEPKKDNPSKDQKTSKETDVAQNNTTPSQNEANKDDVERSSNPVSRLGAKVKPLGNRIIDSMKKNDGKTDEKNEKKGPSQENKNDTQQVANQQPASNRVITPTEEKPALSPLAEAYKDEKRYALVIGNSAYPKTIGVLRNPVNDATDFAKELRASNFEVQLLTNATYGQMRAAMLKFKEKIDAGEKDKTVSLFYYAGHGVQYEDENYLVPVDAMIEYQDDISRYCFGVQKMVLANMERSNSRMNIVILDACRNNPFPAVTRSLGNQGLGEMRRARGSFIAYATAPGSVASDGTGRNGLYTQELLKAMRKPGLTIEQVFKDVRANVLKLSDDKQNTWDSSNIVGEFYFKFQ